MKTPAIFLIFSLLFWSCNGTESSPAPYAAQKATMGQEAAVVSPHPLTTAIGIEILKKGGNAVDAAIAVQFAMAVAYPRAGNLGGGGFMVLRQADGASAALDYREKAPAGAHRDLYLDSAGQVIEGLSRNDALAAGIPGTVAGMEAAFEEYSALQDWGALIQPAIDLAKGGYPISPAEAERLNGFQEAFRTYNEAPNPFIKDNFEEWYLLKQPVLAETLKKIQLLGAKGFYEGPVAEAIVKESQSRNGIFTLEDLQQYQPAWRTPTRANYRGYTVISMPPASSGGVALSQMLQMAEPFELHKLPFHSAEAVHLMTEVERRAFADRAAHLGDTDFYDVPMDSLLSNNYLEKQMADFDPNQATPSTNIIAGDFKLLKESFETTHTSVVDANGMAVSVTTTLNSNFGSKVWVRGGGFFLNNEMDDFSAKPGVPNQFGLVGAEANAIEPGKRMLSSMTPTIVERDGDLYMVLGAPGGSTIITAVFQVITNVIDFGMPLEEAVNAGRFHHQWLPDEILLERGTLPDSTIAQLKTMGHNFHEIDRMAVIKAILKDEQGILHAVGDFRNPDDDARGY
ncbi:MAG: gamma-glutamyltransferase [Mameliella sp.]|nr:gamma-glutamyltransferase [Phaeodactylibacter sp.]